MRKVVMVYCMISFLYAVPLKPHEALYRVDDLVVGLDHIHLEENQVDQLNGMFKALSVSGHPKAIQLMALLIKSMAYDCQQKDDGNAIISLINCYIKKRSGLSLDQQDSKDFSESLQQGEPHKDRKKRAEEMLFGRMIGYRSDLPARWKEAATIHQKDVFNQLEKWRETSPQDLSLLLPELPLENLFSDELDFVEDAEMAVV